MKGGVMLVTISDRLKEAMAIRGLKQADIVEKTGMNKGALSSYISGRYEPKQNNIYLLAKALDVSEAWLMGHDVPMDKILSALPHGAFPPPASLPADIEAVVNMYQALDRDDQGEIRGMMKQMLKAPKYNAPKKELKNA
jgi:transcriptional regulator with XRE-family HTH domain